VKILDPSPEGEDVEDVRAAVESCPVLALRLVEG
jgi:ferredoxin